MSDPKPPARLHCYPEGDIPPTLADDLAAFDALPLGAQEAFWGLLEPNLKKELGPEVRPHVERFCKAHGIERAALVGPVRACRNLMRRAAQRDLDPRLVRSDLSKLLAGRADGAEAALVDRLGAIYDKALPVLRGEDVLATLHEFGAVLDDVRARLDMVPTSRHATGKMVPVAHLSLTYRQGGKRRQLHLQVPPEVLGKLAQTVSGFVKKR